MKSRFLWAAFLVLAMVGPAFGSKGMALDPATCLECHEDKVDREAFASSVHGRNSCTSCHLDVADLDGHMAGKFPVAKVDCARCHKKESNAHAASVHGENEIACADCHSQIHAQQTWADNKEMVVTVCTNCHEADGYQDSVHGQAVLAGSQDSAACGDCHGLHDVSAIGDGKSHAVRAFHTAACVKCHGDAKKMEENGVYPEAVETFLESYHGKSYRLGFPELAAGCADCHGAHKIMGKENAASTLNGENLVATCGQCHEKATMQFTKFYAHGDHADRSNYPVLYWTYIGMTMLLVGTFAVFWIHTLLWMFRGFVENREKQRKLAEEAAHFEMAATAAIAPGLSAAVAMEMPISHLGGGLGTAEAGHAAIPGAHKLYRRFESRHIILHLFVIISFLGLSLTGLPLKFSDQQWAKTLMSFYGGVHYAGLIHRGCAVLTFYYFLGALLMSVDFLFIRKDVRTSSGREAYFLQRLFGPDSLMPNFRDIRDIQGMVRWFLFRGPKPTFERWTYWEKFDFLAVFWGMFAIGGSGLLLWFPEFFGLFLPGWMFNVATIVHSDEALLATGFIFTVHFFNTHGRPEKFPMDFVIFNGQMTKEEFIEERGDQWGRYQQLGITEEFAVKKPSGVLYDFLFKGFGFVALFTGLTLALLMLLAFIH